MEYLKAGGLRITSNKNINSKTDIVLGDATLQ